MAADLSEHFVVGDAHVNYSENRHRFLCDWLGRFRGVSNHPLGYLDFLGRHLNVDNWFEHVLGTDCYTRA